MSKRIPKGIKDGTPLKLTRSDLYRCNKQNRHADMARLEVLRNNGAVKKKLNNSTKMKRQCQELTRNDKAAVKESNKSSKKCVFTEQINPKNSQKINIRKRLDELFQKELHNVRKKCRQCEKEDFIKRNAVKYDQCDKMLDGEDRSSIKYRTYNQNTTPVKQMSVLSKSLLTTLHDTDEVLPQKKNLFNGKEYYSTEPNLKFTISSEKNLFTTDRTSTDSWHEYTSTYNKYSKVADINRKLVKIFGFELPVVKMSYKQPLGSEQIGREKIYAWNRNIRSDHLKKYMKEIIKYIQRIAQKPGDTLTADIGSNSEFLGCQKNMMKSELKALMSQYFSVDYESTTSSLTEQSNANVLMQNAVKKIAVSKQGEEMSGEYCKGDMSDEYCKGEMSDEYCEEDTLEMPCKIIISTQVLRKNEVSTSYGSNEEVDFRHLTASTQKGSIFRKYDAVEYRRPKYSKLYKLYRHKKFKERSGNDILSNNNYYKDFEDVDTYKEHMNVVPKVYDPKSVICKHLNSGKRENNAKYIYYRVNEQFEKTNTNERATRNIKDMNKQKRNSNNSNIPAKVDKRRHSHEFADNGKKKKETQIRMPDKDQVLIHKMNIKDRTILRKGQMPAYNNIDRRNQNHKEEYHHDSIKRSIGKYTRKHIKRGTNQYNDMSFSYKLDKNQKETACDKAKICKNNRSKHSKIYARRNGLFDLEKVLLEANKHTKEINKKKCSYTYVQKIVASPHKNYNRSNVVTVDIVDEQKERSKTYAKNKQAAVKRAEELSSKLKSHKTIVKKHTDISPKQEQYFENNNGSQSYIYQKPNKMTDSVRKLRKNQNNKGIDVMMKQTYIKLINRELCNKKQLTEVFYEKLCILKGFESEDETSNYLSKLESGKNFVIQNQLYEYPNNNRQVGELKIDEKLPVYNNCDCDTSQSDEFEKYQVFALHDKLLNKKKSIPAKLVSEENYKKVLQNLYKDNSELRCKIKKLGKSINERIFRYPARVQEYSDEIGIQTGRCFEKASNYSSTFELEKPLWKKHLEKQNEKKEGIKVKPFAALPHKT
ncbi:uncharacterized protein LOC119689959 [Teleopsis dalmanni]|uniref:uncharacterized protein LOC119689959 n=1 Tax=Teleopsis dalmanni TaxID=139649 RepID=UPI0018CD2D74|nr:uncharacterized protein LOC119689959 [Teleopsis dalmanni]